MNAALEQYLVSPDVAVVMEALTAAICIYQAGSIVESSRRMDTLIDKIVQVTLQHRLCMFPTLMIVIVWLICLPTART